jgi:ABC-type phosphate transport system permease subunit
LQKASLAYLAVILLVISLVTNLVGQIIVRRTQRKLGHR